MNDELLNRTFSAQLIVNRSKTTSKANQKQDHYHDFYEIYYYLGNEMNYFIDNKTFNVKKHHMVFIDRYMLHRTAYAPQNSGERILILFHSDILNLLGDNSLIEEVKELFQRKRMFFSSTSFELMDSIMNRICSYYTPSHTNLGEQKAKFALLELLLTVLENAKTIDENSEEQQQKESPKEKRVSEVVTYINENYYSDITLDVLCKELFINKYYLCHIFKEITGLSVVDFINTKRLAEAERLLRYSRLSITEICENVGFNSISHFINLFKKSYQCTPRAFRSAIEKSK